jgi:prepilin-type N-terminal cleavage/methylation domain-containing protein
MIYYLHLTTMRGVYGMAAAKRYGLSAFSLVEVLLVVAILGILAGMTMLVMGRSSDNAEAGAILSDLDAAKNAMLAYSMQNRTRTSDGLGDWDAASSAAIKASLDAYLGAEKSGAKAAARFNAIKVRYSPRFEVGFNQTWDAGVNRAIQRRLETAGAQYSFDSGALWLQVR